MRALEQSLRRLRTDYVDLLWLHMRDHLTPIEEAVRALDDQVRLGKVLHVGISDSPAWLVAQANTLADLRGWSPFVALQIPYSAAGRSARARAAARWPRRSGWRSSRGASSRPGSSPGSRTRSAAGRRTEVSERSRRVLDAPDRGRPGPRLHAAQVAIAWMRQRPAPPTVVPLVAATREEQIVENLAAARIELDEDELAAIDDAGRPELGFPRDFLESRASAS